MPSAMTALVSSLHAGVMGYSQPCKMHLLDVVLTFILEKKGERLCTIKRKSHPKVLFNSLMEKNKEFSPGENWISLLITHAPCDKNTIKVK